MNSLTTTNNDLTGQLRRLGLQATAQELDDLIARATKQKWSPLQLIEAIARSESAHRAARNLHMHFYMIADILPRCAPAFLRRCH